MQAIVHNVQENFVPNTTAGYVLIWFVKWSISTDIMTLDCSCEVILLRILMTKCIFRFLLIEIDPSTKTYICNFQDLYISSQKRYDITNHATTRYR